MTRVNTVGIHRFSWVIGIDEVGRGPLAGPVTLAAVAARVKYESGIIHYGLEGIRDSKKLSPKQRERWDKVIKQSFLFAIASAPPSIIDKKGIRHACSVVVTNVLKKILLKHSIIQNQKCMILLDGSLAAPSEYKNQRTIIRGDETEPLIAAASIIAKVHRDRYMERLHKRFPRYGFDTHKGYGTTAHRAAIRQYGLSRVHRVTFCRK